MSTQYLFAYNGQALKSGTQYFAIPDPSLYVNDTYIPFDPAGSYQDVSVLSTFMNSWEPSSGSATWITFSNIVNNGIDGGWGSFRATAANNNVADRTGTINVIARYSTWVIDVSQNKVVVSDSISINPTFRSWDGATEEGVSKNCTLTASGSWTASVTSDPGSIVTAFTASGSGSQTVSVTLDNAASKGAKYAQITYTRGTASCILDLCISGIVEGTCEVP